MVILAIEILTEMFLLGIIIAIIMYGLDQRSPTFPALQIGNGGSSSGKGDGFACTLTSCTNGALHAHPLVQSGFQWTMDQYQAADQGLGTPGLDCTPILHFPILTTIASAFVYYVYYWKTMELTGIY